MQRENTRVDVTDLLNEAEVRAEQIVALFRLAIVVSLGLSFFVVVQPQRTVPDPVLQRQWIVAGATMGAYFVLGLASWIICRRGWFRPWMIWPTATGDCAFLLIEVWLSVNNTGLSGNYAFLFPSVWLAPLVLALGMLRVSHRVQAYSAVMILVGLGAIMLLVPATAGHEPTTQDDLTIHLFLSWPPNYIRLTMLALTGAALVLAAVRARQLLLRSLIEAQQRLNLTRYLPQQLAPVMARGGLDDLRRGRRQEAGVLFVDMRGFTNWSENRAPEEVTAFMTSYRERILRVVRETDGILDKFMGDAAMIVFEGGIDPQAAARDCIACAEGLSAQIAEWSRKRCAQGRSAVRVGIGFHWGTVFSGVVGDQGRLEYSVFGDTVNTAARLEHMTRELDVETIASRDILARAGLGVTPEGWVARGSVEVRGRSGRVEIFARAPSSDSLG